MYSTVGASTAPSQISFAQINFFRNTVVRYCNTNFPSLFAGENIAQGQYARKWSYILSTSHTDTSIERELL